MKPVDEELPLELIEDVQPGPIRDPHAARHAAPWQVLVVDDDPDVHIATELALRGIEIAGRPLALLSASSGAEARTLLARNADVAVVLLDVVMETSDAGLVLVEHIRRTLGRGDTRIVLRTGQPGYAPELDAIRDYDINDYKTKSELTRSRLVTTLTAAIRSYAQIRTIEAGRRGLDVIVRATSDILSRQGLAGFAEGVIAQLAALLGTPADGLACARHRSDSAGATQVLAATGRYRGQAGRALADIDPVARTLIEQALDERRHVLHGRTVVAAYFGEHAGLRLAACLDRPLRGADDDLPLFEVFCNNVSVCAENLRLLEQLREFAYVDALVGLPNRLGLIEELDRRVAAEGRGSLTLALADIDGFAEVNNALGHAFGDALLRAFARQLRERLDPACVVARVGNDVFAVLGTHDQVNPRRLREAINGGVEVDRQRQPLTVTLGLLRLAEGSGDGADLLKDANIALKNAQRTARGQEGYYSAHMGTEIRERVRLLDDLRDAIDRERLFVVYQPQVDLETGRAVGAEALLR